MLSVVELINDPFDRMSHHDKSSGAVGAVEQICSGIFNVGSHNNIGQARPKQVTALAVVELLKGVGSDIHIFANVGVDSLRSDIPDTEGFIGNINSLMICQDETQAIPKDIVDGSTSIL